MKFVALAGVVLFLGLILISRTSHVSGLITADTPGVTPNLYRLQEMLASTTAPSVVATSTNATSTNINAYFDSSGRLDNGAMVIAGAKKVTLYFTRGGAFAAANTGTSTYFIQVSRDGTNWTNFNKLVAATSTTISNANELQNVTIGATVPGNVATTTQVYSMDLTNEAYFSMRCIVTILVDGASSCSAFAQY